ncbi:hypothetical protein V5O48_017754 [Marasmius crinis-equi]|uniref:JmjC domain-containing protein n=1 Tax=Marasmius crinis-equi TaxID=585013 RepID=A0ABR3EN31_9AGAR
MFSDRQRYQVRELSRDVDQKNDRGANVGDIFYRGDLGWIYLGQPECLWMPFNTHDTREIVCPMPKTKKKRILNTKTRRWVKAADFLYSQRKRPQRPTAKSKKARTKQRDNNSEEDSQPDRDSEHEPQQSSRTSPPKATHTDRTTRPRTRNQTQTSRVIAKGREKSNEVYPLSDSSEEDDEYTEKVRAPSKHPWNDASRSSVADRQGPRKKKDRKPADADQDVGSSRSPQRKRQRRHQDPDAMEVDAVEGTSAPKNVHGSIQDNIQHQSPPHQRSQSPDHEDAMQVDEEPTSKASNKASGIRNTSDLSAFVFSSIATKAVKSKQHPETVQPEGQNDHDEMQVDLPPAARVSDETNANHWTRSVAEALRNNGVHPILMERAKAFLSWVEEHNPTVPFFEDIPLNTESSVLRPCDIPVSGDFECGMLTRDFLATQGTEYKIGLIDSLRAMSDTAMTDLQFATSFLMPESTAPVAALSILAGKQGLQKMNIQLQKALGPEGPPSVLASRTSTTLTPAGHTTPAHIDPFPSDAAMFHLLGRKIWVVFPATKLNVQRFLDQYAMGDVERPIEWWMTVLEGAQVYLLETPNTSFIMPAGTIHSCISIDQSSHTGGYLATVGSFGFSAMFLQELDKRMKVGTSSDLRSLGNDFVSTTLQEEYPRHWKKLLEDKSIPEEDSTRVKEWVKEFFRFAVGNEEIMGLDSSWTRIAKEGHSDWDTFARTGKFPARKKAKGRR